MNFKNPPKQSRGIAITSEQHIKQKSFVTNYYTRKLNFIPQSDINRMGFHLVNCVSHFIVFNKLTCFLNPYCLSDLRSNNTFIPKIQVHVNICIYEKLKNLRQTRFVKCLKNLTCIISQTERRKNALTFNEIWRVSKNSCYFSQ